jgi:glyoxylase-like metal-dependent hydrolase (beta-lactamase superfamily II)
MRAGFRVTLQEPQHGMLARAIMSGLPQQQVLEITGILGQPDTVNVYFLMQAGEALLIDSGRDPAVDAPRILEFWRQLGSPRMTGIILTHAHPDHSGAAFLLRDHWQVPLSMHEADLPILQSNGNELRPDHYLTDGETVEAPGGLLTVLHTPGHSPGHVCLYRPADGLLISGDQVLTNGTTYVGEPHGNMTEYLASFRRLLGLRTGPLAPGHGPVTAAGHDRILELHEYRLRREGEILMGLRTGLTDATEIARLLYRDRQPLPEAVLQLGINQTQCHLEHLERTGMAVRTPEGWVLT